MDHELRVGVIGANAETGWARDSHIPALQRLDGVTLSAVAASNLAAAEQAAHAFGAEKAYEGGLSLIDDPEIDVVAVTTRVTNHREFVLGALAAGKHVYCEWPLGRGLLESREMAQAAAATKVHTAIGLQLRQSPQVKAAGELIASGKLGRILKVNAYSSTVGFGPTVPAPFVYLEDPGNFANLVTIQGAHTLDLLIALLGGFASLAATTSRQFPEIEVGDNQDRRQRTTFDHLLVQGHLRDGAPVSVEVAGGQADAPFRIEIHGEKGALHLSGNAPRGLQSGRITLGGDTGGAVAEEGELTGFPDSAVNVAGVYAALRDDITQGTRRVSGFTHAEKLSALMEEILASAAEGRRRQFGN